MKSCGQQECGHAFKREDRSDCIFKHQTLECGCEHLAMITLYSKCEAKVLRLHQELGHKFLLSLIHEIETENETEGTVVKSCRMSKVWKAIKGMSMYSMYIMAALCIF